VNPAPPYPPGGEADRPEPADGSRGDTAFPVVGVGASAGGLEAFGQLLGAVPDDTGMAFVLVQHLDPKHESKLGELLARATRMPVIEATQGLAIRPDHVYVIPPNTYLAVAGGILQVTPRGEARGLHLPIDHFLKSLAEDRKAGAVGVILSGTGSDGTLGVEEIKAAGGFTLAQDEGSARYPGMPLAAAQTGAIDLVLPPGEIALALGRIGRHPYAAPTGGPRGAPPAGGEEGHLRRILAILRASAGVDFSGYRDTTIKRRIMRRTVLHTKTSLADYAEFLERDRTEVEALYHDLLVNVTSFFRESETFEALKSTVFPALLTGRDPHAPIRVWVAGCSTGQEAYSLAIALLEFLTDQPVRPALQIFATDLSDTVSLRKARQGCYPRNIEAEVSPERLRRFFTREDDHYRISKSIRDACVFARHNVAADPPFSRVDLVSCRNVLIYLAAPLQKRVIQAFHYALKPAGYLLLGHSETVGGLTDLFGVADPRHRIYVKRVGTARPYPHFGSEAHHGEGPVRPATPPAADWQREADRVALGQYAPPGVLVNASLEVLQFRGRTGPYLEPAPGEPSTNLLRMAREGLAPELRSAVNECRQRGTPVRRHGLRLRDHGPVREVALRVLPVNVPGSGEACFLVLFEEAGPPGGGGAESGTAPDALPPARLFRRLTGWLWPGASSPPPAPAGREEAALRHELATAREHLQALTEQHDAAEEELKSANEEVLSSNEELQSTNEELQTAKEELQSLNEELTTINEQLQQRNQELTRLGDDLSNLLGSANVPMVLLGTDLCVRRLTPAAGTVLNLLSADVGRPLGNIKLPFEVPDLEALVTGVMSAARVEEREVQDRDGRWHSLRVYPYRTADDKIDGAVIVLLDVHETKTAGLRLQEALDYARAIVETVRDPLLVLDAGLRVRSANRAFYETFGGTPGDTEGRPLYDLGDREWDIPALRTLLEEVLPKETAIENFEVAPAFAAAGPKVMLLNARRLRRGGEGAELILLAIEDVTERRRAEESLRRSEERFRLLAENVTDYAIFFMDAGGKVVSWEEGSAMALGYRAEEIVGQPATRLFTPEDAAKGLPERELQSAERDGRAADENWLVRKDGTRFWASGVTTALRDGAGALRGFVKIVRDVTELKRAEEGLRRAHDELELRVRERTAELLASNAALEEQVAQRRELLRRLGTAEEEQRHRIARELHDQMGQHLAALRLGLKSLEGNPGQPGLLRQLQDLTNQVGKEVHRVAMELRPTALDDLGLPTALRNYAEEWSERSGIGIDFRGPGGEAPRLPPHVETAVYRIVQEALTNVIRHARATRVSVIVERRPDHLLAIVEDNGTGFAADAAAGPGRGPGGLGLPGMKERAALAGGTLEIESSPGKGTTVFARIPLPEGEGAGRG
jgi:two-component system CheB/CheR fusion protein